MNSINNTNLDWLPLGQLNRVIASNARPPIEIDKSLFFWRSVFIVAYILQESFTRIFQIRSVDLLQSQAKEWCERWSYCGHRLATDQQTATMKATNGGCRRTAVRKWPLQEETRRLPKQKASIKGDISRMASQLKSSVQCA